MGFSFALVFNLLNGFTFAFRDISHRKSSLNARSKIYHVLLGSSGSDRLLAIYRRWLNAVLGHMTFVTLISLESLVLSLLPSAHQKLECASENQRQNDNNSPSEHTTAVCAGSMNY